VWNAEFTWNYIVEVYIEMAPTRIIIFFCDFTVSALPQMLQEK